MNNKSINIIIIKTIGNKTPNEIFSVQPSNTGTKEDWPEETNPEEYAEWDFTLNNKKNQKEFIQTAYELLKYTYQYNRENYIPEFTRLSPKEQEKSFQQEAHFLLRHSLTEEDPIITTDFGEIHIV